MQSEISRTLTWQTVTRSIERQNSGRQGDDIQHRSSWNRGEVARECEEHLREAWSDPVGRRSGGAREGAAGDGAGRRVAARAAGADERRLNHRKISRQAWRGITPRVLKSA